MKSAAHGSCFFFFCLMSISVSANAAYEAAAFTVDIYGENADGYCCPTCDNTNWGDDHGSAFKSTMLDIGYTDVKWWANTAVDPADWVDGTKTTYGNDDSDYGIDWSDVAYLYTHGSSVCSSSGYYSSVLMGNFHTGQACSPNTRDHFEWGGGDGAGDLNIVLLEACKSVQYCVEQNWGYYSVQNGDLSLINGYDGLSNHGSATRDDLITYIETSQQNGAGENWVILRTDMSPPSGNHTCATSFSFGDTGQKLHDVWDQGLKRFVDPGTVAGRSIMWITGCESSQGTLP